MTSTATVQSANSGFISVLACRNLTSAGFTPEERESFDRLLLQKGFKDVFRERHPEVEAYTYGSALTFDLAVFGTVLVKVQVCRNYDCASACCPVQRGILVHAAGMKLGIALCTDASSHAETERWLIDIPAALR